MTEDNNVRLVPLLMLNTIATVGVVFIVKYLFSHNVKYPTLILVYHQGSIALITHLMVLCNVFELKYMPIWVNVKLAFFEVLSIVSLNLSLDRNTISTFQIMKLLNVPAMCVAEYVLLGKTRNTTELFCLFVIVGGVGFVTTTDYEMSAAGVMFGVAAVLGTTLHQVYCKKDKGIYEVSGLQFMSSMAPYTTLLLLPCAFLTENVIEAVTLHSYTVKEIGLIVGSCLCALVICVSLVYIIGATSAVTYQVLGHVKTVLIIFGGIVVFRNPVSAESIFGMIAVLGGSAVYSFIKE